MPDTDYTHDDAMREAMTHDLKIWPEYFDAVVDGRKTWEVRTWSHGVPRPWTTDRDFRAGDTLHLREWESRRGMFNRPEVMDYTGREVDVTVTYAVRLPDGKSVGMSIARLEAPAPRGEQVEALLEQVIADAHELAAYSPGWSDSADARVAAAVEYALRAALEAKPPTSGRDGFGCDTLGQRGTVVANVTGKPSTDLCPTCVRRIYQTCPIEPIGLVTICKQYGAFAGAKPPTSDAVLAVLAERERQDAKWGGAEHDDEHTMGDWALFLCEHTGHFVGMTLSHASHPADNSDLRQEAVQVSAVALAIVESIDRAEAHRG